MMFGLILLSAILYLVVRDRIFGGKTVTFAENFHEMNHQPGEAALEIRQSPVAPPRTVMPSGPSPPSQSAPGGEMVVYGDPHAKDPYADNMEASDAPETMRYPERSFRPAPANDQTQLAMEAGIAGVADQTSPQAYQKFGTEGIQNSGEFMNGVYANDVGSDTSFSAF
jgi:hypothetical protein